MKKAISYIGKRLHWLPLLLFSLWQARIIRSLALFGDDYYYASFFSRGVGYFLSENVRHYTEVNGRAFVHLLDELLLWRGTMTAWKIFASVSLLLIAALTAFIASDTHRGSLRSEALRTALPVSCLLLSLFSVEISRQTLYWATGFMNYVFPVLLTLLLFYMLERALDTEKFSPILIPLAFFASCTTEQNSFASLCILLYAIVRRLLKKRKIPKTLIAALVLSLAGVALLFAAPGNAIRTTYYAEFYALPFTERVSENASRLLSLIFEETGAASALALFFAAFACGAVSRLKGKLRVIFPVVNGIASVSLIVFTYMGNAGEAYDLVVIVSSLAVYMSDLILLAVFFFRGRGKYAVTFFFTLMAALLQAAMLVSPEMGPRTVAVSVFFLAVSTTRIVACDKNKPFVFIVLAAVSAFFVPLGNLSTVMFILLFACGIFFTACRKKKPACSFFALSLAVLMLASLNTTLCGYKENTGVHRENAQRVSEYRDALCSGEEPPALELSVLPNKVYKYTMPYDSEYHMYWFKIMNGLDTETEIIYK